jgi:hypothetical protein
MSDRRLRRVLLIVGAAVLGLIVVGAVAFAVFVPARGATTASKRR